MSKNIEYESRVMIDLEQYEKIKLDHLSLDNSTPILLTNYYFDTSDLALRKNGMMLRIRSINDCKFELTLKIKEEKGDLEINHLLEINHKDLSDYIKNFKIDDLEINKRIKEITNKRIIYLTKLSTARIEVEYKDYLLVIDKNNYSNIEDYDIEIESSSREKAIEIILKYCDKYHLKYKSNYQSKSKRAFKAINLI